MSMPRRGSIQVWLPVLAGILALSPAAPGQDRPAVPVARPNARVLTQPATPAVAQPDARHGLKPYVPGCPVCDLWEIDGTIFLQARQEVGALENGVIYYYFSDNPTVIEQLIRFAYERQELEAALRTDLGLRQHLGQGCGHAMQGSGAVHLEISTGVQGVFVILTSTGKIPVDRLKREASNAVRDNLLVRF
jgi:hypothetical protein